MARLSDRKYFDKSTEQNLLLDLNINACPQ